MRKAVAGFLFLAALRPDPNLKAAESGHAESPAVAEYEFAWFTALAETSPEAAELWDELGIRPVGRYSYEHWSAHRGAEGLFLVQQGQGQMWLWDALEGQLTALPKNLSRLSFGGKRSCLRQTGESVALWAADPQARSIRPIWRGPDSARFNWSPTDGDGLAVVASPPISGAQTLSLLRPGRSTEHVQVELRDAQPGGHRWWNKGRILLQAPPHIPEGLPPPRDCGGYGALPQQVLVYTVKTNELQQIGEPVVSGWASSMGCGDPWHPAVAWSGGRAKPTNFLAKIRTVDPDTLQLDRQSLNSKFQILGY